MQHTCEKPYGHWVPILNNLDPTDVKISKVVQEAIHWKGTHYKYGGTGKGGIDCSALTQKVFKQAVGIKIPRTANQQWQNGPGKKVLIKQLKKGDLVFFQKPHKPAGHAGHVGIYLGDGKMINSQCHGGVKEANIHKGFGPLLGGRRIL